MARLKLFGSFRSYVSSREINLAAATLRQALDRLWSENPKLRAAMVEGEALRPYVRLLVNGRQLDPGQGLDTPLGPEDEVAIFSPMAGG
jgi:molybdopterin synthase sulfur carrier subunit